MPEPRQPQDHKPKAEKPEETPPKSDLFTFTHQGDEFTLPLAAVDHITFGFYRRKRNLAEADFVLEAWEKLADGQQDVLDVLDRGGTEGQKETKRVISEFEEYLGATSGE